MTKKFMTLSILMTGMLVAWPVAAGNPPSATGHADLTFGNPVAPSHQQYSFVAHALKSGVRGQVEAEMTTPTAHVRFHVEVDCLTVAVAPPAFQPGLVAGVSGIITNVQSGGIPAFAEGTRIFFAVQDRGEGAGDPPDRTGPIVPYFFAPGPIVCPALVTLITTETGNVQVRN